MHIVFVSLILLDNFFDYFKYCSHTPFPRHKLMVAFVFIENSGTILEELFNLFRRRIQEIIRARIRPSTIGTVKVFDKKIDNKLVGLNVLFQNSYRFDIHCTSMKC